MAADESLRPAGSITYQNCRFPLYSHASICQSFFRAPQMVSQQQSAAPLRPARQKKRSSASTKPRSPFFNPYPAVMTPAASPHNAWRAAEQRQKDQQRRGVKADGIGRKKFH